MLALAIILYVFAGLFMASAASVGLMAPVGAPAEALAAAMAVTFGIGTVFFLIGAACVRFQRWMGHLGWTLMGASGGGGAAMFSVYSTLSNPAATAMLDRRTREALENADFVWGGGAVLLLLLLGGGLLVLQARRDARSKATDQASLSRVFD